MENSFGVELIPENDEARLAQLRRYKILDSPTEEPFTNIVAFAAQRFKAPIALISLIDKYRVWYKASVGLEGLKEVPRGDSLCSLVILNEVSTVFEDALTEPCLLANPFVAGEFGLRFYAGAPIKTFDGFKLGAICIIDKEPRSFSEEDRQQLELLASIVMDEIKQRLIKGVLL